VISLFFAIVELPAIIGVPDIATGCFGMGGDHDDQTKSLQDWEFVAFFGAAIAYVGIALGWLGVAFKTVLRALFPRVNWD
jgi:hypothetical protein